MFLEYLTIFIFSEGHLLNEILVLRTGWGVVKHVGEEWLEVFSLEKEKLKENITLFELWKAISSSRNESYWVELHRVEGSLIWSWGMPILMGMMIDFPIVEGWGPLKTSSSVGASVRDTLQRGVNHQVGELVPSNSVTWCNSGTVQCGPQLTICGIDLIGKTKMEETLAKWVGLILKESCGELAFKSNIT